MNISKHNLIQIQDLQKEIEENDDLEKTVQVIMTIIKNEERIEKSES